jgi:hypothetical protein
VAACTLFGVALTTLRLRPGITPIVELVTDVPTGGPPETTTATCVGPHQTINKLKPAARIVSRIRYVRSFLTSKTTVLRKCFRGSYF